MKLKTIGLAPQTMRMSISVFTKKQSVKLKLTKIVNHTQQKKISLKGTKFICILFVFCYFLYQKKLKQGQNLQNKEQCSRQLQCEVPCGVGYVINSSLFINSSILPCSPCLPPVMLDPPPLGDPPGGGDGGHFIHPAIYCTTTWCFTLKGLHTINTCSRYVKIKKFWSGISIGHFLSDNWGLSAVFVEKNLLDNLPKQQKR